MSTIEDPLAWAAAQQLDPVRQRMLLALARRAAAQPPGPMRDKLLAKLLQRAASRTAAKPVERVAARANPLAALRSLLDDSGQGLRQLRLHQGTWRQLRVARRLAELSAPVPLHLGPLNSQVLATRALQQLQSLAPDYLHRFLAQMDAIAALTPVNANTDIERAARAPGKKAAVRRK
ncbi:DUF2894 domain-containing protein [Roseateles violae]|uniref:DUF2894 domain-containing protein n=1 Tax=Roseateles violae TaxID=3058042 RepID=A0ABT8DPR8_9BURK|nr:DUF2894 domain-containing protein [Pelomonas sp. PFR6]MDN3920352.1 DUF2894 domain-containing protein [Pelomonas sp. PFR6]